MLPPRLALHERIERTEEFPAAPRCPSADACACGPAAPRPRRKTSHERAPWWVIPSDDKKLARLNCISDLLSRVQYTEIPQEHLSLPSRDSEVSATAKQYQHPPPSAWNVIPQIYTRNDLVVPMGEETDEARGTPRRGPRPPRGSYRHSPPLERHCCV